MAGLDTRNRDLGIALTARSALIGATRLLDEIHDEELAGILAQVGGIVTALEARIVVVAKGESHVPRPGTFRQGGVFAVCDLCDEPIAKGAVSTGFDPETRTETYSETAWRTMPDAGDKCPGRP